MNLSRKTNVLKYSFSLSVISGLRAFEKIGMGNTKRIGERRRFRNRIKIINRLVVSKEIDTEKEKEINRLAGR